MLSYKEFAIRQEIVKTINCVGNDITNVSLKF